MRLVSSVPYFQAGNVTIYHGDCREVLALLPANAVDVIVTDPPYGVKWKSNHRNTSFGSIAGDEDQDVAASGLIASLRCLRPYRHVYAFGRLPWDGMAITSPVELVWDKGQPAGGNVALPWAPEHEYIQFGVYVPSKANRKDGYGRLSARLRQGSVLSVPRVNGVAVQRHPTEKPVLLLRYLIESSSLIGETVLDPFMGSGSTLEAALIEGRRSVGVEVDERYCELAARRLELLAAQGAVA